MSVERIEPWHAYCDGTVYGRADDCAREFDRPYATRAALVADLKDAGWLVYHNYTCVCPECWALMNGSTR